MNDLAIFYITCFSYYKLWEPYLILRKKYIGEEIKCYICSDKLPKNFPIEYYHNKFKNLEFLIFNAISNIKPKGNYFKRYLYYLNNIKENYIIYNYDDYFPSNYIDNNKLKNIHELMEISDDIKIIKLKYYNKTINKEKFFYKDLEFLRYDNVNYIISTQPFIIKKNIFIDISNYCNDINKKIKRKNIKKYYSAPGMLEIYGSEYLLKEISENKKPYIYLTIFNNNLYDYYEDGERPGIVYGGIISNNVKNILEKNENIHIETNEDGLIFNVDSNIIKNVHHFYKERLEKYLKNE